MDLLNFFAKLIIKKYKPEIIVVIGGIAKTSTQRAIFTALSHEKRCRTNKQLFDDLIDIPLTVVSNLESFKITPFFWPHVIFDVILNLLFHNSSYPEILILEIRTEDSSVIKKLTNIFQPKIVVITAFGDMPLGIDTSNDEKASIKNRSKFVEILPSSGYAIINADDLGALELKERTRAKTITYGFSETSDLGIINYEIKEETILIGNEYHKKPRGIGFKMSWEGNLVPIRLFGCVGKIHTYIIAAAATVALTKDWNLIKIANYLDDYDPLNGRMKIIAGIKNTYIIDDSYNASPFLMKEALMALKDIDAKRRIAVLGDMLEIGKYSPEAHEELGMFAGNFVDILFTVGPRGAFLKDGAKRGGLSEENIYSFDTPEEAGKKLQEILKEGDLILVKGTTELKMEKVIEEIKMI